MMLGLCAVLGNRYQVRSNRESGRRRFDVQLAPLVSGIPGFYLNSNIPMMNMWIWMFQQIVRYGRFDEKKYDAELRSAGINSVIKIGIAFRGKMRSKRK